MKEFFKIAWRNLWRNKKRTLITVASIFFAVFLALIMRSMQLGSYSIMIENSVRGSTGYIQIHAKGYWDDKSINNSFEITPELESSLDQVKNLDAKVPRVESFALASFGKHTKGVAVMGVIPDIEDRQTGIASKIIEGDFLSEDDGGVLVAEGLAEYLNILPGDSLVLLSQGYHGTTAADLFPVRGIIKMPLPEMNNALVYITLKTSQYFFSAPDRATSYSFMLDDPEILEETRNELALIDPENLEVMTWKEMLIELVQGIESDNISGLFMIGILYVVVGFGILGTIIMMTMERRREFGIMVAVGMKKVQLMVILMIETVIITCLGILAGAVASLPVLAYFRENPIRLTGEAAKAMLEYNMEPVMPFVIEWGFYTNQSISVLVLALLASIYPLRIIGRMKVVNAMKGK